MQDLIGDILSTFKLKSAVYFKYGFCTPWGMDIPKGEYAQFHIISNGRCILKVQGHSIQLEKGDIVIFPRGTRHQIMDQLRSKCRPGGDVVTDISNGTKPFAGEVVSSHLICGHYEIDREFSHPIFDQLPEYLIIKSSEYGRFDLIHSTFELIVEEMALQKPGHETVSLKLAEILFISIIRHYYLKQTKTSLNLFKDEMIYEAIDRIHKELDKNWSLQKLAKAAGVSRTLFIERFKNAVGETPMKYINNWRMTKAIYLLKNTELSLTRIGEQIGYFSETSFNRAFKQKYAISPGKFRNNINTNPHHHESAKPS